MKKKIVSIMVIVSMLLVACSDKENMNQAKDSGKNHPLESVSDEAKPDKTETEESDFPKQVGPLRDGNYIIFGRYEQDGDLNNGMEPIEWEILSEEDGKILLLSRYILDWQPYSTKRAEPDKRITWETCSLRTWLNNDFLNTAFNEEEQLQIAVSKLSNPDNPINEAPGGNDTEDRVFCLSVDELRNAYEFDVWASSVQCGQTTKLITEATPYMTTISENEHNDCCGDWWLRSPGEVYNDACAVMSYSGAAGWSLADYIKNDEVGVRPAIYINATTDSIENVINGKSNPNNDDKATEIAKQSVPVRTENYIIFGHYEQDADISNGPEPIEWEIVSEKDGKMLLVSRYILDQQKYNSELSDVTWETSSLRTWLNTEFLKSAFNDEEQIYILKTTLPNWLQNDTEDVVFCLSLDEITENYELYEWNETKYSGKSKKLDVKVSHYCAYDKGVQAGRAGHAQYWLRTGDGDEAFVVGMKGYVGRDNRTSVSDPGIGVRPAIVISVDDVVES